MFNIIYFINLFVTIGEKLINLINLVWKTSGFT